MSAKKRYGSMETKLARHETYQTGFRRIGIASILMAVATTMSVGAAWWSISKIPEPRYFMAREDGGIIPLVAVSQPYLSDGEITNFAVEAVTKSLTMNFATWKSDLAGASDFYQRPDGWNNFLKAIETSGTLDFILNRRLISSVVANGAVVVRSGARDGVYSWVVQVPITITYQTSSETSTVNQLAEVEISRLPTWQTARGVGITRILIK